MEKFKIKTHIYEGKVEQLNRKCDNIVYEISALIFYDGRKEKFMPKGDIGNIVVTVFKKGASSKCVGYGIGEIRSGERTFWISCPYFHKQSIPTIMVKEIEKYFRDSGIIPQRQNYYYYGPDFPYNMRELSYHKLKDEPKELPPDDPEDVLSDDAEEVSSDDSEEVLSDDSEEVLSDDSEEGGMLYAKALNGELDGETKMLDTLPDGRKINWLLRNKMRLLDELGKDKFLECIKTMKQPPTYVMGNILNEICNEEGIYEKTYRIFSMKIHNLERPYTMEEIVYHNHLIEYFSLRKNNIVEAYGLNDADRYYTRIAGNIKIKSYSKRELLDVCGMLSEHNSKNVNKYTKTAIIHKLYGILGRNINFVLSNEKFHTTVVSKIKEFRKLHCGTEQDLWISDRVLNMLWMTMIEPSNLKN